MALRAPTKDGDLGATSRRSGVLSNGLLGAEAALAVVLLVCGGLLVRSFFSLMNVDGGYDPRNVSVGRLYLPPDLPEGRAAIVVNAVVDRLRSFPGVKVAGAGNMTPFDRMTALCGSTLPAASDGGAPVTIRAHCYCVTPGYAESLGLTLSQGRFLTERDQGRETRAVLVNAEFARAFSRTGLTLLGGRHQGLGGDGWSEIVGVVGNVLKDGLERDPQPAIYSLPDPAYTAFASELTVVARTNGNPRALAASLRSLVHGIDRSVAVDNVGALSDRLSASLGERRFSTGAMVAFAGLALALAMSGLFAVLSHDVMRRRREMGVRAALGARRIDLVRLVLGHGLAVTAAGLLAGLGIAAGVTRLLSSVLFGVEPLDALTFTMVPMLLLPVAAAACLLPAYRASRADPSEALRCE